MRAQRKIWGIFLLIAVLLTMMMYADDEKEKTLTTGNTDINYYKLNSNKEDMSVSLVWYDDMDSSLDVDYDLTVTIGKSTFKGNVFDRSTGFSTTGGSADRTNCTETVSLKAGTYEAGFMTVSVYANNASATTESTPGYYLVFVGDGCQVPPTPKAGKKYAGSNLELTASEIPGATYSWTGPNGFTSYQQNPVIPDAKAVDDGPYYVTATVNGCSSATAVTPEDAPGLLAGQNIVFTSFSNLAQVSGHGDNDANVEPGEAWSVRVTVTNSGTANATNVKATLSATDVTVCQPELSFGNIGAGLTGYADFEFFPATNWAFCGTNASFNLTGKKCDEMTPAGTDQTGIFTVKIGQPVISPYTPTGFLTPDDNPYASSLWIRSNCFAGSETHCAHSIEYVDLNYDSGASPGILTLASGVQNTVGYYDIDVIFDYKFDPDTEAGDGFVVEYYDGATWNSDTNGAIDWVDTNWHCGKTVRLPAGANNNPYFLVRFRNLGNKQNDDLWLDYIYLTYHYTSAWDCTTYVGPGTCSCTNPGAPTLGTITDVSSCTNVIRVPYTPGTPAGTSYDLYKDGTKVVDSYTSNADYTVGDTSSHTYKVRAVYWDDTCYADSGTSNFTDVNNGIGTPTISSVTDADACAQSGVTITWGAVTGATSYDLYIDSTTTVTGVTSPYLRNPGDTNSHSYQVRANNASCTGSWSTAVAGTDAAGVGVPTISSVVDANACAQSGVTISWGSASGATGFDLYVDSTTVVQTVTSPYLYNPGDTSSHNYQVRGKNASCTGAWSTAVAGTDSVSGSIGTPTISSVVDADACAQSGVTITWGSVSGATSYDLYIDSTTTVTGVTSPYLRNPGDTASHNYQVRANSATCTSSWSAAVAGTDANNGVAAPTISSVTDVSACAQSGVTITWGAVSGATGYDLYVDATTLVAGVTSPYVYNPGDTSSHGYQVRAKNASCTGSYSASVNGTDVNSGVGTPTISSVVDVDACAQSGVTITWGAISGATGYDLYIDATTTVSGVTSPYLYSPADTASHNYQVRAKNATCTGSWSTLVAGTDVNSGLATPTITSVVDDDACAQSGVTITWGAISGATAYSLYVDSTTIITGVTSPYLRNPGDTSSHNYQVRARNASCTGSWSAVVAGTDANNSVGTPTISSVVDADACAQTGVTITWGNVSGATAYDLYVDSSTTVNNVTSPYLRNPGDTSSHNYQVRAKNASCTGSWSAVVAGTDANNAVGTPTISSIVDLNACASDGVTITWGNVAGATAYDLFVDSSTTVNNVTSPYLRDPSDNASHNYQVRAKNASCTGSWSAVVAAADVDNGVATPTISSVVDADACAQSGVTITWGAVTGATTYDLYVDASSIVNNVTSPYLRNPGDTSSHNYQIRAKNASCTSTWSAIVAGTDANNGVATPTISSVVDADACAQSGVTITWGAVSGATAYDLYVDATTIVSNVTSPYLRNPGDTASHNYQVRAKNASCTGSWSAIVAGTDVNSGVGAPTISVVDADACAQSGVNITWGAVSGATGYDLYVDSTTIVPNVTSPYLRNPGDTSSHNYQVRAKNASCTGSWSTVVAGTDANNSVGAPTISSVTDVDSLVLSGVSIAWGAVSGATGYDLYVDATTVVPNVTSPYVYQPGDSSSHNYQVRAKNASCTGSWSSAVAGTDQAGIGTPTISSVTDINVCTLTGVSITWGAVTGATGYDLYVDATTIVPNVTSPYTYEPGNSTSHNYQVRAKNASFTGSWSTAVAGTDAAGVGTPTISSVTDFDACIQNGVNITWGAVSGATAYDLYVDATTIVTDVSSPYLRNPGDTSSHNYQVRAKSASCTGSWSAVVAGTDAAGVGTPSVSSVVDADACAQSGVTITWGTVSGATAYDLYVDASTIVPNVTSPYLYTPGDTSSHVYQVRGKNASCNGAWSTGVPGTDAAGIGTPTISSVSDISICAQSGVSITWGGVAGATAYDLYVDATTIVPNVISSYTYIPGDVSSHNYQIRGKNATCTGSWSAVVAGTDAAGVETPVITSVIDADACAQSGITITWGAAVGATAYDLYIDASTLVADVTSPYLRNPGDTSQHTYQIRGKNATCVGSWSTGVAGTDAAGIPTPTISSVVDISICAESGVSITWGGVAGATAYDLYVDGTTIVPNVISSYTYMPGDLVSHNYQIRGKNASCTSSWSTAVAGTDTAGVQTPDISSVVDADICAQSGVTITWGAAVGATAYDLYVDASTIVSSVTSPYLYNPGDTLQHTYQVRGKEAICVGSWSTGVAQTDVNSGLSAAAISSVVDVDACAMTGVTITWGAVSGATAYDLYVDATTIVNDVTSPYLRTPGDTSSHNYQIRAKNASCTGAWSSAVQGIDANGKPSTPVISSVVDWDGTCSLRVTFTGGTPATRHDLWVDGALAQSNISSPTYYSPGEADSHNFVIRTYYGTCYTDSTPVAGEDPDCCIKPTQAVDFMLSGDNSGFTWAATDAINYRVVRGEWEDLPALKTADPDFSCYTFGPSTSVNFLADWPIIANSRCYYYIVQGYNCWHPEDARYIGPAGTDSTGTQRIVNTKDQCE